LSKTYFIQDHTDHKPKGHLALPSLISRLRRHADIATNGQSSIIAASFSGTLGCASRSRHASQIAPICRIRSLAWSGGMGGGAGRPSRAAASATSTMMTSTVRITCHLLISRVPADRPPPPPESGCAADRPARPQTGSPQSCRDQDCRSQTGPGASRRRPRRGLQSGHIRSREPPVAQRRRDQGARAKGNASVVEPAPFAAAIGRRGSGR